MTDDEMAIQAYCEKCKEIGLRSHVEYGMFDNGDTVRVTIEITPPLTVEQWERLHEATSTLCELTGLQKLSTMTKT
jgi:hypothetical protein